MKRFMISTLKIVFAASTVFGIAYVIGVVGPDGEVPESEADIISFDFAQNSPTKKFTDALDRLGHSDPVHYGLNGNAIFFSENRVKKDPLETMIQYQQQFVDEGINTKIYTKIDASSQSALMRGEIVPIRMEPNTISMSGLVPVMDLEIEPGEEDNFKNIRPDELYAGYHAIDITRETDHQSMVTANFSSDFSYEKMTERGSKSGNDVDIEVPTCPSCDRINRFTEPAAGFSRNTFQGSRSKRETEKFYLDAMARRGWELTDTSRAFRRLKEITDFEYEDAAALQFTRGDEFLNVLITSGDEGTTVHSTQSR